MDKKHKSMKDELIDYLFSDSVQEKRSFNDDNYMQFDCICKVIASIFGLIEHENTWKAIKKARCLKLKREYARWLFSRRTIFSVKQSKKKWKNKFCESLLC